MAGQQCFVRVTESMIRRAGARAASPDKGPTRSRERHLVVYKNVLRRGHSVCVFNSPFMNSSTESLPDTISSYTPSVLSQAETSRRELNLHILSPSEEAWVAKCEFFYQRRYALRPRYQPQWRPSWELSGLNPGDCEDGIKLSVSPFNRCHRYTMIANK
jgi:hypothetical protein